ncbi:MAG: hypothetical protein Q8922_04945 [Bacteroidota bacterium]|nr:hypothetical protein [Bacteroidota bacterium]MDP4231950.1 hypothetical protein [Bacteroidota bacterium]MDP4241343.1 hypothetical protein [Bacteroidota bacterium]MDP4287264.1 hypothetical protein [Bacteroidota bacterium]
MIGAFRHIALGGSTRKLTGFQRVAAQLARVVSIITVLVFFADTINADILYAAIKGDVRFDDNPLILDSATDGTGVIPASLVPHTNYFALAKYDGGAKQISRHIIPRFHGTTIIEDADSPSVLDGATTATLTFSCFQYDPTLKIDQASATPMLDRTITYSRLLI